MLFDKLKEEWSMRYITRTTLRKYVLLEKKRPGSGITEEQYQAITGEAYE